MPKFNQYTQTNDEPDYFEYLAKGFNATSAYPNDINILQYPRTSSTSFAKAVYNGDFVFWVLKHKIPQAVLDAWAAEQIAFLPVNEQTNFWTKMKNLYGNVSNNVQNTVQNTVTNFQNVTTEVKNNVKGGVQQVIDKGKEASLLRLFVPFGPIAILFLKRRGITPAKTVKGLVLQVNEEMTKKGFGLSANRKKDAFDYGIVPNTFGLSGEAADAEQLPINPGVIINTIKFLKDIFDAIKTKSSKGDKLTEEERAIADNATKIQDDYDKAKDEAKDIETESETKAADIARGFSYKNLLLVLLLFALVYFLIMRK